MLDVEVLYHGKGRETGVTDLCDGRKLPIWFDAWDFYRRLRCESEAGGAIIEFHMCLVIPECWCTADEVGESWAIKINLIEEGYTEVIELGGIDVGHEVL